MACNRKGCQDGALLLWEGVSVELQATERVFTICKLCHPGLTGREEQVWLVSYLIDRGLPFRRIPPAFPHQEVFPHHKTVVAVWDPATASPTVQVAQGGGSGSAGGAGGVGQAGGAGGFFSGGGGGGGAFQNSTVDATKAMQQLRDTLRTTTAKQALLGVAVFGKLVAEEQAGGVPVPADLDRITYMGVDVARSDLVPEDQIVLIDGAKIGAAFRGSISFEE